MANNRPTFEQGYPGPPFQYLGAQSPAAQQPAAATAQYPPGLSTAMYNPIASTSANGGFNSVSQTWSNTPLHNIGAQGQDPGVQSHGTVYILCFELSSTHQHLQLCPLATWTLTSRLRSATRVM